LSLYPGVGSSECCRADSQFCDSAVDRFGSTEGPGDHNIMQAQTASGWRLLVVSSLLVLAACTNFPSSAAGNGKAGATQVAGTDPVTAVSDALGQRLDTMLRAPQVSH
jgi:hypothetical protein